MDKKDNSGLLFKNKNKKTDKHPDMTGFVTVDGKDWRIAGWKRTGKEGETFLSLAVSEPREKPQATAAEDDIPF